MNLNAIASLLGTLLLVTACAMCFPMLWALAIGGDDAGPLMLGCTISAALGGLLRFGNPDPEDLTMMDSFIVASLGWVLVSMVSAIPFIAHGSIPDWSDAFFEMMSGYTTTGATILPDIEALPRGLLLWRSETHLVGGMGFVTLVVTLLPHGLGGLRLFRAESSPGQIITKERFLPRNRDAIRYLWGIYLALNLAMIVMLMAGGMDLFDSLCHTFGAVSTSGYSPYNSSIGHYNSVYFDAVITLFMFLGGVTFMLFFSAFKRDWQAIAIDTELRWYCWITGILSGLSAFVLYKEGSYGLLDSLRYGTFQVVSLLTTTGYSTADFEVWPQAAQMLLVVACFVGACAGSTTSGIKIVHYVLITKFSLALIRKQFQPLAVMSVRLNGRRVSPNIIHIAQTYFIVNVFMVLMGGCVITLLDDVDMVTATSSITATLMNVGPGWGEVGPTDNFGHLSAASKIFLSFNMLVGRLEVFSVLVLFYPGFWKQ